MTLVPALTLAYHPRAFCHSVIQSEVSNRLYPVSHSLTSSIHPFQLVTYHAYLTTVIWPIGDYQTMAMFLAEYYSLAQYKIDVVLFTVIFAVAWLVCIKVLERRYTDE
jgi:hypothetical protein